jgi:hypothetical protein
MSLTQDSFITAADFNANGYGDTGTNQYAGSDVNTGSIRTNPNGNAGANEHANPNPD